MGAEEDIWACVGGSHRRQENIAYWSPSLFDLFTVCYHNAQNRKDGCEERHVAHIWGEEKWVQSFDAEF